MPAGASKRQRGPINILGTLADATSTALTRPAQRLKPVRNMFFVSVSSRTRSQKEGGAKTKREQKTLRSAPEDIESYKSRYVLTPMRRFPRNCIFFAKATKTCRTTGFCFIPKVVDFTMGGESPLFSPESQQRKSALTGAPRTVVSLQHWRLAHCRMSSNRAI
jgi:hypothetical protein